MSRGSPRRPRSIKCSDVEWQSIAQRADALGMTRSGYLRSLALRDIEVANRDAQSGEKPS